MHHMANKSSSLGKLSLQQNLNQPKNEKHANAGPVIRRHWLWIVKDQRLLIWKRLVIDLSAQLDLGSGTRFVTLFVEAP